MTTEGGAGAAVAADIVQTIGGCSREDRRPEAVPETTHETVSVAYSAPPQAFSANTAPRQSAPPFRRRLPRFIRAKRSHRPPLALQDRDLELLSTAHEYRLISTPQYLRLFADESRDGIYRRLQKLFHHGYLDRIGSNPNAPLVYALGLRGANVLEVPHGKEVGERYLLHQFMVGSFRIALTLAARGLGVVVSWRQIAPDLPVRPDGFFGLQFPDLPEGRNRAFFFLEADRSTMPRERMATKFRAYRDWAAAGGHTERLGIKRFRVLTVTRSEERLESLLPLAADPGAEASMFWFACERAWGSAPSSIFADTWRVGNRPTPQSILPAPAVPAS